MPDKIDDTKQDTPDQPEDSEEGCQAVEHSPGAIEAKEAASQNQEPPPTYLSGWRLHLVTFALYFSLYLATLEVTIVSTALITITDDLKAFGQSSWIVTSYLLTYTGFLIFWAKLSDILGRKTCIIIAVSWFVAFSAGCGAAQTALQLILLCACQGIGASGIYSLVMVIVPQLVPFKKFAALYSPLTAAAFSVAYLTGPLFGGIINNNGVWRWVFLLNVPCGACAVLLLMLAIPKNFPHHSSAHLDHDPPIWKLLRRVDVLGTTLLLASSVILVTALEEVEVAFAKSSPTFAIMVVLAACAWICFLLWSKFLNHHTSLQEPVFTWRFIQNRYFLGILINTCLVGVPFSVAVINIPQRMQAVNDVTPLVAGVRLLAFSLACPFGSALSGVLLTKLPIPSAVILCFGGMCQSIGAGCLSSLSDGVSIDRHQYGYEFLLGFGIGLNIALLITLTPAAVQRKDLAVAMGAVNQFRLITGAIGLGISAVLIRIHLNQKLEEVLSPSQLVSITRSTALIPTLSLKEQRIVRAALAEGYDRSFKMLLAFGIVQVPAAFLVWSRKQIE